MARPRILPFGADLDCLGIGVLGADEGSLVRFFSLWVLGRGG